MQLGQLVTMRMGANQRRLSNGAAAQRYTYQDLLADLAAPTAVWPTADQPGTCHAVQSDDLVFSLMRNRLAPVSPRTVGKVLTQNFVGWHLTTTQVTPQYLCYCLNQATVVRQQLERLQGGDPTAKLSLSRLQHLDIPILPLTEQRLWGRLYFNVERQRALRAHLTMLQTQVLQGLAGQVTPL